MKKRLIGVFIALFVVIPLVVCGCSRKTGKVIGVVQFVHHPLLDETCRGLMDGLKRAGLDDGKNYQVKVQIADKNTALCSQIVRQYSNEGAVAIVAIATPAAQAAMALKTNIPIIFAAITDPVSAKLVASLDRPGGMVTGTSNRWPFDKQIGLISRVLPKAKNICTIWNPGESNSEAAMKFMRPLLRNGGYSIIEVPVASTADVAMAANSAIGRKVDAFLVVPDNTVLAATTTLTQLCIETKKPLIGGDMDTVRKGSIASYGYDYFELGNVTAEMVRDIVLDGKDPAKMAVRYPPKARLVLNQVVAAKIGISFPPDLVKSAEEIVK